VRSLPDRLTVALSDWRAKDNNLVHLPRQGGVK
jgi:hypothetical protein